MRQQRAHGFARVFTYAASAAAILMMAGCYVESADRPESGGGKNPLEVSTDATKATGTTLTQTTPQPTCRFASDSGCVAGQIPTGSQLNVEGKSFFDADDLRVRFADVVKLQAKDGKPLPSNTYSVRLLTPLDNKTFARGFQVTLLNDQTAREADAVNGGFALQDMAEGDYDVRVAKPLRFEVTQQTAPASGVDKPQGETKVFCAKLYAERTVSVHNGAATNLVFKDYSLYVSDSDCSAEETGSILTL